MIDNIFSRKKIKGADGKVVQAPKRYRQVQHPIGWKETGVENTDPRGLLGDYLRIEPSAQNIAGEKTKLVGKAALYGGLLGAGSN